MARAGIFLLWLLHFLPLPVLGAIGRGVGLLAYVFIAKRRRIARTNLRLCFPESTSAQRERLLRGHFLCFGRALLESGLAWWAAPARLQRVVRIEGDEHMAALKGKRFVLLVPHFVGIELEGLRLTLEYRGAAVYVRQKDSYVDAFLKRKRERFAGTRMIARQEGVKAILRALKAGQGLQLSPDVDLGARDSIFVPFFGVPAATVTVLSRVARLAAAHIVPVVIRQLPWPGGYVARFYPPWEGYPGVTVEEDTRRMNDFIEARVREIPEQYLWTHRRFKTRPAGEPDVY
jgi:KDO2-lipid IV(A) lauroyltransferase